MNLIYAAAISCIMAAGLYLLLSRHIVRMVYGVMMISAGVNLAFFLAGRIGERAPAVIPVGQTALGEGAANPLPQALVLTAIVIGFSLVAFVAALIVKIWQTSGTLYSSELHDAEALGDPFAASAAAPSRAKESNRQTEAGGKAS